MTVAYNDCSGDDPLLPPELLPRPWPGRPARELLVPSRRLALGLREQHGRPALFRWFDEVIETIPDGSHSAEDHDEVRHLLRAPAAPAVGRRRRAPAAQGRARAGRAGRPARHRLRVGGRAPLPRGVLATRSAPEVFLAAAQPAHQPHPPRPRHRAAAVQTSTTRPASPSASPRSTSSATDGSSSAPARSSSEAELGGFGVDRGDEARAVERGARRRHPHVRRGAVRRLRRRVPRRCRRATSCPSRMQKPHPPLWVACSRRGHDPPRRAEGHRRAVVLVHRARRGQAVGRRLLRHDRSPRSACPAASR